MTEITIEQQIAHYLKGRKNDKHIATIGEQIVFKSTQPTFEGKPFHVLNVGQRGLYGGTYDMNIHETVGHLIERTKSPYENDLAFELMNF